MVSIEDFGEYATAWCPGCGNFSILKAVKQALAGLGLSPHQVLFYSGIGQAAKAPHYLRCNLFNGLHGRSLPAATGGRLANLDLPIFVEGGDGDGYGEGGGHFLAALRRNPTMTMLVHDNQIYGLTKGQASPTSLLGMKTKAQPAGSPSSPLKPLALAVSMQINFVARAFSGEIAFLAELIQEAHKTPGMALIDIFQPCVSFNKLNTFAWYKERCVKIGPEHDPTDWDAAMRMAMASGDMKLPIGVIYKNDRVPFESFFPQLKKGPLARWTVDRELLVQAQESYY